MSRVQSFFHRVWYDFKHGKKRVNFRTPIEFIGYLQEYGMLYTFDLIFKKAREIYKKKFNLFEIDSTLRRGIHLWEAETRRTSCQLRDLRSEYGHSVDWKQAELRPIIRAREKKLDYLENLGNSFIPVANELNLKFGELFQGFDIEYNKSKPKEDKKSKRVSEAELAELRDELLLQIESLRSDETRIVRISDISLSNGIEEAISVIRQIASYLLPLEERYKMFFSNLGRLMGLIETFIDSNARNLVLGPNCSGIKEIQDYKSLVLKINHEILVPLGLGDLIPPKLSEYIPDFV
jgi:hypothetical protein